MKAKIVYIKDTLAEKYGADLGIYKETLQKFCDHASIGGLNFEKLHGSRHAPAQYSIRHDKVQRLILSSVKNGQGEQVWVVTDILEKHEYDQLKFEKKSDGFLLVDVDVEEEITDSKTGKEERTAVEIVITDGLEYLEGRYILLDDMQAGLKAASLPLIIRGAPGSGKSSTLLAIIKHQILQWAAQATQAKPPTFLIIAQSPFLVAQLQKEWAAMSEHEFKDLKIDPNLVTFQTPEMLYQAAHPGDAFVFQGEAEFGAWYNDYAVRYNKSKAQNEPLLPIASKKTKTNQDITHLIYQEFYTMSGYETYADYCTQVGDKFSLFSEPNLRSKLWTVFNDYKAFLSKNGYLDLAFIPLAITEDYTFLGVDESPDLSRLQLRSVVYAKERLNPNVIFCVGDHQRLFGTEKKRCLFYAPFIGRAGKKRLLRSV
ncbi:hypothetical protein ACNVED_16255 (plasmid) [Legionella sp. D16C41]|uniref:hypothetical protein n=1 Tax=Legionella sp. D16C41 TaxID=3402688 RepID=UPI003AF7EFDF